MTNAMKPILSFAVTLLLAACAVTRRAAAACHATSAVQGAWFVAKGDDGPCNPG
jgi:hypothetical protein